MARVSAVGTLAAGMSVQPLDGGGDMWLSGGSVSFCTNFLPLTSDEKRCVLEHLKVRPGGKRLTCIEAYLRHAEHWISVHYEPKLLCCEETIDAENEDVRDCRRFEHCVDDFLSKRTIEDLIIDEMRVVGLRPAL
jgi:hypothetical protein